MVITDARIPRGGSIGPGGKLLSASGVALLDADGYAMVVPAMATVKANLALARAIAAEKVASRAQSELAEAGKKAEQIALKARKSDEAFRLLKPPDLTRVTSHRTQAVATGTTSNALTDFDAAFVSVGHASERQRRSSRTSRSRQGSTGGYSADEDVTSIAQSDYAVPTPAPQPVRPLVTPEQLQAIRDAAQRDRQTAMGNVGRMRSYTTRP